MRHKIRVLMTHYPKAFEFIKFGMVGSVALIIHYLTYYLLLRWMNYNVSFTVGYIVSLIVNFLLTISFTFRVNASMKRGAGFVFSHICNYLMQIILLNVFLSINLSQTFAPVPVYMISVPLNFIMVRFFMRC